MIEAAAKNDLLLESLRLIDLKGSAKQLLQQIDGESPYNLFIV
jgi:hypothetical protein